MARRLTDADLSKVAAKVIPCGETTIRRRFAIEYLGIDHNEYKKIAYNQRDNCEEIVYESLQKWRQNQEEKGKRATVQSLVEIFEKVIKEEAGWISKGSYPFLYQEPEQRRQAKPQPSGKRRGEVLTRYSEKYACLMSEIANLQKEKERLEEDRARVQEKLRMKEEIARAPFWNDGHMPSNRCRSLLPKSSENSEIKKCRSF